MKNKNILLAVTGMSPQVVTETIFALYKDKNVVIDEVRIITTSKGAEQAWLGLAMEDNGNESHLNQLCKDYNLPEIKFTKASIRIIPDANGNDVADARSIADHNSLADFIINEVRELTDDNEVTIYASLAGGRKTMTFFLGYAMSLFGRAKDMLTHVLVNEDFENLKDFFYPTPYNKRVVNYNNIAFNAKDAIITLAEIPFVRMREEMPERIIKQKANYSETVELMNIMNQEPNLVIDLINNKVKANDHDIHMARAEITFLTWAAERTLKKAPGLAIPFEGFPKEEYAEKFIDLYKFINGGISDKVETALSKGMDKNYFNDRKAKVKKAFITSLGKRAGVIFSIQSVGKENERSIARLYGLAIKPENIKIIEPNKPSVTVLIKPSSI